MAAAHTFYVSDSGTLYRATRGAWVRWLRSVASGAPQSLVACGAVEVGPVRTVTRFDASDARQALDEYEREAVRKSVKP